MYLTAEERMLKRFENEVPGHGKFRAKGISTTMEPTKHDARTFWSWVSTIDTDEEGDVVDPRGADWSYFPGSKIVDPSAEDDGHQTVYMNHNYDNPITDIIGACRRMQIKRRDGKYGMYAMTYITESEVGDQVLRLIKERIIRGMSIGFRTIEAGSPDERETKLYGPACKRVVRRYKMVEYSVTAMPMNSAARIDGHTVKSFASREVLDRLEIDTAPRRVVVPLGPEPVVVRNPVVLKPRKRTA